MYFVFYLLYLIGAQFPLFLLLIIRNFNKDYSLFFYLFLISITIIIVLLIFFRKRIKINQKPSSNIKIDSDNLVNSTMIEFFSFFLLPFFTFNLSYENNVYQQIIEIIFLFLLLTVFLYRSGNLLINPILFFNFNLYKGSSMGTEYFLLLPKKRGSSSIRKDNNKDFFIQITNNIVLFSYNDTDTKKVLKLINGLTIALMVVLILSVSIKLIN